MEIYNFIFICCIGFCSAFISSSVAIGSGIFLVPTLALIFPAKLALAIGAPIILVADILALPFYWKQWASKEYIRRLIIAVIPGLILGIVLLPIVSVNLFKFCLGIFGMLYAISMGFPNFPLAKFLSSFFQKIPPKYRDKEVYFFGPLAGLANIFAHSGGLVWSAFLQKEFTDKRIFMGTLLIIFTVSDCIKTAAFLYIDLLSFTTIFYIFLSTPFFILGSFLGNKFNKRIDGQTFKYLVLFLIFIASFNLCT